MEYQLTAWANNEFTVAGELLAAYVVQGGPAPYFLSKEAFGQVVDGIDSVSTDDWIPKVHNEKYKGAIEEVKMGIKKSPKITVKLKYFCSANCHCQPTASTCDPSITFPLHYDTYDAFCKSISSTLVEGCGFGFV